MLMCSGEVKRRELRPREEIELCANKRVGESIFGGSLPLLGAATACGLRVGDKSAAVKYGVKSRSTLSEEAKVE